jgi:hypothetical protein
LKKLALYFIPLAFLAAIAHPSTAQWTHITNLPKYDEVPYHFGFSLGLNQMFFTIKPMEDNYTHAFSKEQTPDLNVDSSYLFGVNSDPVYGFNIGIVADKRIGKYLNVRFLPALTFGERRVNYSIQGYRSGNPNLIDVTKNVSSTFVDLPILFKYRSKRLVNFAAYLTAGAQYSIDLASGAKKKDVTQDVQVKLTKQDVYGIAGVGFDFYNPWFKFGLELRMMYGIFDILQRDNTIYSEGIDKMTSKIFQVNLTFE